MKIRKTLLHATIGLVLISGAEKLQAQTALTWDDCVKEASAHNPDLLAAEQSLKAADDTHVASLGQFFPQISFNASINRNGSGGLNDAFNSAVYGQNSNLSLNATQDIFSGFKDFASVDQSNAQLDTARAQLQQAKAQLSHDLRIDFYGLLYAQKQIDLFKAISDRQKANMDLVGMNFKGGTDNKGSFLQAQAAYQEAVFELDQAKRNLRVSQRQLDQALGRGPMDDVEVTGDFETPTLPADLPNFASLALQTPAHRQSLAQLHLSE
ncbi:MAG TPA: TolC family protein, partial [bacterium]|nr:TolC family protein [bacterium]